LKIFVTGFSPFAGAKVNPAWEAVKRLPGEIAGADIVRLQIPVAFVRDGEVLRDAIRSYRPDAVLCVGQAGGRAEISVERIAVNLMDSAIPDNDGVQPADMPICPHGKSAYFSTLPVKTMVQNIRAHGIPASVSNTAGTYVCNDVMYRLLFMAQNEFSGLRGGFIHVPFLPEQTVGLPPGTPSMSVQTMTESLRCALESIVAALTERHDTHDSV